MLAEIAGKNGAHISGTECSLMGRTNGSRVKVYWREETNNCQNLSNAKLLSSSTEMMNKIIDPFSSVLDLQG